MDDPATRRVMDALGDGQARFVGGCVRNALLNVKTSDIDIATVHLPETVMERMMAAGIKAIPTGLSHGTVTAVCNDVPFEITTLRRDVTTDGRHADVAFTDDWAEDAARRDFTMNALYADLDGIVYDYTGGIADARLGRVRFIGDADARIREDYLRILRFFRFFAAYGHDAPDADAIVACARHAPHIETLSRERVRDEMLKLLVARRAADAVGLMVTHGIMPHVMTGADQTARLREMTAVEEKYGFAPDALRRLAAVLRDHAPDPDLRLSHLQADTLAMSRTPQASVGVHSDVESLPAALYRHGEGEVTAALLMDAVRHDDTVHLQPLLDVIDGWRRPRFPVTGADVLERGVPQDARLGETLRKLETWWINGGFTAGRAECLSMLDTLLRDA